jgi:hypothetical protein
MCATCIASADAPPRDVLIAAIKRSLRRHRRHKWTARVLTLVPAVMVWSLAIQVAEGAAYMSVFILIDLYVAWMLLKTAEVTAVRADHALKHLRLTEALKDEGDTATE